MLSNFSLTICKICRLLHRKRTPNIYIIIRHVNDYIKNYMNKHLQKKTVNYLYLSNSLATTIQSNLVFYVHFLWL